MTDPLVGVWREPTVTINGTTLTNGEAMTIRVALGSFALSLQSEGLGDDEHGKAMTGGYLAAVRAIMSLMMSSMATKLDAPNA